LEFHQNREGHNLVLFESSVKPGESARTLMKIKKLVRQGEVAFPVADQRGQGGNIEGEIFGKKLKLFGGPFIMLFHLNGKNLNADVRKVSTFFERLMREHPEQHLRSRGASALQDHFFLVNSAKVWNSI
jgi:hypothetical protein